MPPIERVGGPNSSSPQADEGSAPHPLDERRPSHGVPTFAAVTQQHPIGTRPGDGLAAPQGLRAVPSCKPPGREGDSADPVFGTQRNAGSPVVQRLAALHVAEPNLFERIWDAIRSLFVVVDRSADVRAHAERVITGLDEARTLVDTYADRGAFDETALAKDLEAPLKLTNPHLDSTDLVAAAAVLAEHARIMATNRARHPVEVAAAPRPTRPLTVEATPYTQRDVVVAGTRLRYIDVPPSARDEPLGTILLLHGHQSTLEELTPLIPALSRDYRILCFDLPGSGYSDHPDRAYSLRYYEETVLGFLDALGVEQAIPAGGSLGGNLALRLARHAPQRFPRVVAWSPASTWPPGKHDVSAWVAENLMGGVLYWPLLHLQSHSWYADNDAPARARIEANMRYRREVDSAPFRRATAQIAAEQLRASHRGLGHLNKQPTLIMVGDQDHGLDLAKHAVAFSKELPRGELVTFAGAGHSVHTERPKDVTDVILAWLARHP